MEDYEGLNIVNEGVNEEILIEIANKLDQIIAFQQADNTMLARMNDGLLVVGFLLMIYFGMMIGRYVITGR